MLEPIYTFQNFAFIRLGFKDWRDKMSLQNYRVFSCIFSFSFLISDSPFLAIYLG